MEAAQKWILYWRNSLADGDRQEVRIDKASARLQMEQEWMAQGRIPGELAADIIHKKEQQLNKSRKHAKQTAPVKLQAVDVALAPFYILSKVEHGLLVGDKQEKIYPFWIPAILGKDGLLYPPSYPFPRVLRSALEPLVPGSKAPLISSVDEVDEALAEGQWEYPDWEMYWAYCTDFFAQITGQQLHSYKLSGYLVRHDGLLITDEQVRGASHHIIRLYDELRFRPRLPRLFLRLAHGPTPDREAPPATAELPLPLAHLSRRFALSASQRTSLRQCMGLQHGELLAVKGPPGTGKTTLLQAVVANAVVKSALQGGQPAVVVATSTNNQAVKNILESLRSSPSHKHALFSRWLPGIRTYAMYLPASRKEVEADVSFTKIKGGGLPAEIEQAAYLEKARSFFLEQCQVYAGQEFETVNEATHWLRTELMDCQASIEGAEAAACTAGRIQSLLQEYGGHRAWRALWVSICLRTNYFRLEHQLLQLLCASCELLLNSSWNPSTHAVWLQDLLRLCPFPLPHSLRDRCLHAATTRQTARHLYALLSQKTQLLRQAAGLAEQLHTWQEQQAYTGDLAGITHWLDKQVRYQAFMLAIHYWEGRWLEDIEPMIKGDLLRRNGKGAVMRKWRRYAMLTPCLVSTFYMLPRFFQFTYFNDGYSTAPLLNFIDLLLVDEAGQVSPEVGAAAFALAKKAVVVGDEFQIEPIWKVSHQIDIANLQRFGLIKDEMDLTAINALKRSGKMACSGSLMKMAMETPAEKQQEILCLREHRRCYDEIIAYCNQLAYGGILRPMRGKHPGTFLPPLGYYHVAGFSQSLGGSRFNSDEANQIAQWLSFYQKQIETQYGRPVEEVVGLITPFAAQRGLLRRVLKQHQFDVRKMKTGTIHTLQGAERPIILFSAVYGQNHAGLPFFFDRSVHLLNVAVSRAQDSFLYFGDMRIFEGLSGTPSALLHQYLTSSPHYNLGTHFPASLPTDISSS